MTDLIETIMIELKQRRDWNNPEEVEIWFEKKLREVEAQARAEERESELIVKLQMIRLGIQVFNKSEQERDQEEKKGLVRRDGGRTMSAFSLIKQIDTELEKITKKD